VLKQKEESSKYIGNNNDRKSFYSYIPDVMFSNKGEACDYLLYNETNVYFIELKGSDILKAVDQITNSYKRYKEYFINYSINARIIPTRGNTFVATNSKYIKFKKMINELNGTVITKEKVIEENI
jgi:hypothetical protein